MTVVLVPNPSFLSETTRMLAIFQALEKLGTPAAMACHGGRYEEVLDAEDVPWERIPPIQTDEECSRYLDVACDPFHGPLYARRRLREVVDGEIALFHELDARVVVSGFSLSTALSARAVGAPLVVTHLGAWIPPLLEKNGFSIAEHFDSLFPVSLLPSALQTRLVTWLFPRLKNNIHVFNQVAAELGVEPLRSLFDLILGDRVFVTDVPEILGIPQAELEAWRPRNDRYRPNLRFSYVGAIFAQAFGSVPEKVRRFLQTDWPTVYVAMSSTRVEYLQAVLDTIVEMGVRRLLATTVHRQSLEPVANVLMCDFLPSHEVMPLCDAAVIHGGQGSVQTAIATATPFVGIPLQPEQNVNLKLVEDRGGSRTLSVKSLKRGRLRPHLEAVLGRPSYRETMVKLQALQNRWDGPAEAARQLTKLHAEHPDERGV